jgi:methylglutamate dehydrogenase subunit A
VAPSPASHLVIGGGVQGLSAAWRLAERGADVLVLEKDRIGSGASGIAGGIVRNYYRSAGITEVIARSVEMFEAEPQAYGFRQVGYVACVPGAQADDLVAIRGHHERAGYASELVEGGDRCREFLTFSWPDWEAEVAALLHEPRGGWADAMQTVRHLAARARDAGARIEEGVEVTGFELGSDRVEAVLTSGGRLPCETLVTAPGPWAAQLWTMLGREPVIEVAANGSVERRPLVSYLKAQEGEFELRGAPTAGGAGVEPPVVHLDQAGPLRSDRDGRVLVDGPWGIYFRVGLAGTITGGGLPIELGDPPLDPYGPDNPDHAAEPEFTEFFTSGLATALPRYRGGGDRWRSTPAGGIVSHTPDNYPICDWAASNAYAIVDSGHGFKMLALARMAADDVLGDPDPLMDAFRLARFERGETHVASKGPYPWT